MSSGGPAFWLSYWAVMLSAIGGSISWAISPLIAVIVAGIAAILITRKIWPGRASTDTLTILVLFLTVIVGFLQWQILNKTEHTMRTNERPWVGLGAIVPGGVAPPSIPVGLLHALR